jgi:hypothetical protein
MTKQNLHREDPPRKRIAAWAAATEALGRVALELGELAAITPSAVGYCARVGIYTASAPTPEEAALELLRRASTVLCLYRGSPLHGDEARAQRHRVIDAIGEAYETLGGDWRAE